jgi:hypothetical protein
MDIVVPVNYLAVVVAAIISMVIGSVWYGPLFGSMWMKETGMKKPAKMTPTIKKMMMKSYSLMFVGSLVMAFVLAHAIIFAAAYMGEAGVSGGLMSGFWNWLGFVAPVTLGSVLWEGKSWKMWALNNGYYLVTLLAMGVVLAVWI